LNKLIPTSDFIELVKSDNRIALEQFYLDQKSTFLRWANSHFDVDEDTIIDVYQDAIVTLYFNVNEGKIEDFRSSVEAYLFGIARNLLIKQTIKNQKVELIESNTDFDDRNLDYNIYERIDADHFNFELKSAFDKMQAKCREIIMLYYYNKFTLDSIAKKLKYNNSDTVKARKNQCMKKLKELMIKKL